VLVENHSLKPYRQRVLGTYVLLRRRCGWRARRRGDRAAKAADRAARPRETILLAPGGEAGRHHPLARHRA
jgi:hypothetical protein